MNMDPAEKEFQLRQMCYRLEAATSRLEDMATSVDASHPETVAAITSASVSQPEATPTVAEPIPQAAEPLPRTIEEFDKLIHEDVQGFVNASEKIGGLVEQQVRGKAYALKLLFNIGFQAKAVMQAFEAERTYLFVTTKAKKPSSQPPELLTELHRYTGTVDELREANRPSPLFAHLSAISEGIVALGWIVETRPADFVTDTLGGAQFYGNRVLKEYKEK